METPVVTPEAASPTPGRTVASLPGPRPWPLVGNLPQVDAERMHATLEAWADEYGPLYRFNMGRREVLVVARKDLIAQIFRDRPDGWRRLQSMQQIIREMGSHGLFSAEGTDWRRQRKLVMAAFDPGHLKRYFPSLRRVTERLLKRVQAVGFPPALFGMLAERLDRRDLVALGLRREHRAGVDGYPVQQDRVCTGQAALVSELHAVVSQPPQCGEKCLGR